MMRTFISQEDYKHGRNRVGGGIDRTDDKRDFLNTKYNKFDLY